MSDQLRFDLASEGPAGPPEVILRLVAHHGEERIEADWPSFKLTSWFRDWPTALRFVCHDLNQHVRIRVRP